VVKMKKCFVFSVLVLIFMSSILTAGGNRDSGDEGGKPLELTKAPLLLNWTAQGSHASVWYGVKNGIFRKHGIDLEVGEGKGSGNTVTLIATKNDTFGYADFGTMCTLVAQNAPVKVIAPVYTKLSSAVISIKENNIAKPQDIIGKRIGITEGDGPHKMFSAFLKSVGIAQNQMNLISMDSTAKVPALLNKQVDAILGGFDDQPFLINSRGYTATTINYADFGVSTIGMSIVAHNDTIKNNPDLCRRFVQAYAESWIETAKNQSGALAALLEKFPDLDRQTSSNQLTSALECLKTERTTKICEADDQYFLDSITLFKEYTGLTTTINPKDLYTLEFLPK